MTRSNVEETMDIRIMIRILRTYHNAKPREKKLVSLAINLKLYRRITKTYGMKKNSVHPYWIWIRQVLSLTD